MKKLKPEQKYHDQFKKMDQIQPFNAQYLLI